MNYKEEGILLVSPNPSPQQYKHFTVCMFVSFPL